MHFVFLISLIGGCFMKPEVSVIVPIYNVSDYLRECLDSLAAQTLESIEILMIDDGSTDRSGEISREYAQKYPKRFRYLRKENGGLSDARNFGIRHARGRYLGFVDGDDWVSADMFEKLFLAANENNSQLSECEYLETGDGFEKRISIEHYDSVEQYLLHGSICVWNKIYRKDWLLREAILFPIGLWHEDNSFFCRLMISLEEPPVVVREPLYFYRQRGSSIIHSPNVKRLDIHRSYRQVMEYYREKNVCKSYQNAVEYAYVRLVFCRFLPQFMAADDDKIRRILISGTWNLVHRNCPDWKKNPWLKTKGLRNLYLKSLNPFVILVMMSFIRFPGMIRVYAGGEEAVKAFLKRFL